MEIPEKLQELIDFEKKSKFHPVKTPIQIKIEGNPNEALLNPRKLEKTIASIHVDGICFKTPLNRVFVHQVGGRISWSKEQKAYSVNQIYKNFFNLIQQRRSYDWLELKIKEVFDEAAKMGKNLVIVNHGDGVERKIYGIVSKYYTPTDQADFRQRFIELCKTNNSQIDTSKSSIHFNKNFKLVEEYFSFNSEGSDDILLECGIVYGKNNGYGSYYVNWRRSLKKKKSFLTPFVQEEKYNWQNNPRFVNNPNESINDFIGNIVKDGIQHQEFLEKRIKACKEKDFGLELIKDSMWKVLDRIRIAKGSKERVIDYWQSEYANVADNYGSTTWAVADSLTFIGNHEKAVPKSMQKLLKMAGTLIIEEGYDNFLSKFENDMLEASFKFK